MLNSFKNLFTSTKSSKNFYQVVGEESGVYKLVRNFYEIMETDPKAIDCLKSHELVKNKIPDEVKKKLFMFLCGWFGGPNLFVEAYGHPRMRARHMHVKISTREKTQWLYCMKKALKKHPVKISRSEKKKILNSFTALALRIQNIA